MMSNPRMRKPAAAGCDMRSRSRGPTKAAGDAAPCNAPKPPPSRSKSKLSKSIRFDLDNALVGLCDVWFEEIKPHLLRNNIKVHIHGTSEAAPGAGDQPRLPPGAPGCSHLDPGAASDRYRRPCANSASCCPMQPATSRAPYPRPHALQSTVPPPPVSPATLSKFIIQIPPQACEETSKKVSRRKSRSQPPHPQTTNWMVPRPCRTQTIISHKATPQTEKRKVRTAKHAPPKRTRTQQSDPRLSGNTRPKRFRHNQDIKKIVATVPPKPVMVNKSTQTVISFFRTARPYGAVPIFGHCIGTTDICSLHREKITPYKRSRRLLHEEQNNHTQEDKKLRILFRSLIKGNPSSIKLLPSAESLHRSRNPPRKTPWR